MARGVALWPWRFAAARDRIRLRAVDAMACWRVSRPSPCVPPVAVFSERGPAASISPTVSRHWPSRACYPRAIVVIVTKEQRMRSLIFGVGDGVGSRASHADATITHELGSRDHPLSSVTRPFIVNYETKAYDELTALERAEDDRGEEDRDAYNNRVSRRTARAAEARLHAPDRPGAGGRSPWRSCVNYQQEISRAGRDPGGVQGRSLRRPGVTATPPAAASA